MTAMKIAGFDLGKTSISLAVLDLPDDGGPPTLDRAECVEHEGRPFEAFSALYANLAVDVCAAAGVTGAYADEMSPPTLNLPEDACLIATLDWLPGVPDQMSLLSVGGSGYRVLTRCLAGADAPEKWAHTYLENDKCSSGTGENMIRIADRFGLTIKRADSLALTAKEAVPITARCSVFTKSEMTHHANEGRGAAELFAGYFASVAHNAHALLVRAGGQRPIWVVGGVARSGAFVQALTRKAEGEVYRPEQYLCFEALGAALLCAEQLRGGAEFAPLPADPGSLVKVRPRRFEVLEPASKSARQVTLLQAQAPTEDWQSPSVLGLDLGSTGAKVVLTSVATGEALLDLYDRTRGNPVEAAQRLVRDLLRRRGGSPDIRGVAVTGSGRQAVATVLRAALSEEQARRLVVQNEIVAHAAAAMRCDPDRGEDLSVVEIGGQDAKYIRICGGRVVESDMNMACSAGTGSFLEEQAAFYDVQEIEQMTRLASAARRPPDLGQMCTVYVAEAAAQALKEGFELGDILAGFQFSIIHNYLHRVMGQRTLARRVFFQGKPAQNPSLAWTLAAVSGREIMVPPNPGAMGAWGVGLEALAQLADRAHGSTPVDLGPFLRAKITSRSHFSCRDKGCHTVCPIERTVVRLGLEERTTLSGGECPKFEESTRDQPKLERDAPDPFEAREALLRRLLLPLEVARPGAMEVAIPRVGALAAHLPFLATLVAELGGTARVLAPHAGSLAAGEQLCNSFDSCGPVKVAHAVCDTDAELMFFPKLTHVSDIQGKGGHACVTEQAMPELVEQALRAGGRNTRLLHPLLSFSHGLTSASVKKAAGELARAMGADPGRVDRALLAAAAAQRWYETELLAAGEQALAYAAAHGVTTVLVCGSLHVLHDPVLNASIPRLLRLNGALAIPADAYPTDPDTEALPKIFFGDANRALRAAACARRRGDAFPLYLASFGCGPASFVEQLFTALLQGYPHTLLEADGHGGAAGFVTRIQAFLQSARRFAELGDVAPPLEQVKAVAHLQPSGHRGPYLSRDVRYLFMSSIDYLGPVFAAAYRAEGYDAVVAPPLSEATVASGRGDCSGKECMSYQLIWGAFRAYLEQHPSPRETRLVQISGQMCRAGLYPLKDRLNLDRMGLGEQSAVISLRIAGGPRMSARVWAGMVAVDILRQLYLYHLPVEPEPGEAQRIYNLFGDAVIRLMERRTSGRALQLGLQWRELLGLLDEAAAVFARMEAAAPAGPRMPVLFLSGDQMAKGNDFAAGGAYSFLATQGVRLVYEPIGDFLEFLAEVHPALIFGRSSPPAQNAGYRLFMVQVRDAMYGRVRRLHAWLPMPDTRGAVARAGELLHPATNGGSPYAVGNALLRWDTGAYDGVLMASCWGCDNSLVEESLLRRRQEIPTYFFYDDGTPIDEHRLASFAHRMRRRAAAHPARDLPLPPSRPGRARWTWRHQGSSLSG